MTRWIENPKPQPARTRGQELVKQDEPVASSLFTWVAAVVSESGSLPPPYIFSISSPCCIEWCQNTTSLRNSQWLPTAFRMEFSYWQEYRLFSGIFLQFPVLACRHTLWPSSPAILLPCFPKPAKVSNASARCIRSSCSLTQIHLADFRSCPRTGSRMEGYLLCLLFSLRDLAGLLLLLAPSSSFVYWEVFDDWYNLLTSN